MERLYKESVIRLNISATTTPTAQTNVTFWSYDIDTARQTFEVMKNDEPISLVNASDITLVLQFAGLDNIIHLTPEIEDFENGIISIVLPTQALGFEGEVTGGLFIKFENEQSFDCGYFVFNLRTSSIDHDVGDLANFYVQRFEDLKKWIEQKTREILDGVKSEVEGVMNEWEIKELERQAQESVRISNEEARQSEESMRVSNEEAREEAELVKQNNETSRETQEATRISNEEVREEQETVRQNNEELRQSQEVIRASNEGVREGQETVRQNNEELRQSQEVIRASNEEVREEQEIVRQRALENTLIAIGEANKAAQFAQNQGEFAEEQGGIAETKANEAYTLLLSGNTLINEIKEWYESIKDMMSEDVALYLLDLITNHKNETVTDVTGAHGLRIYGDKVQFFDGTDWIDVEIGTTGAINIFLTDGRNVEEALANKAELGHTHGIENIENLQSTLDGKSLLNHSHTIDNIENLENILNSKVNVTNFNTHKNDNVVHVTEEEREKWNNPPAGGVTSVNTKTGDVTLSASDVGAAPTNHSHTIDNIGNLQTTLDGKAPTSHKHNADDINAGTLAAARLPSHNHTISDVTNLQTTLDGKALTGHKHNADDITSGTMAAARLPSSSTSSSGIVQLNNTVTSTSTTLALTANQGKVLNDNKLDKTANAASATKLQTARTINGVAFDGTQNITISASGTPSAHTHSASDITSGTISNDRLNKASTTQQGIVQLNNTLTSTSTTLALTANQGKVLNDNKLDKTANAASATKLQTARTINGVAFDGTQNITITASGTPSAHTHSASDITSGTMAAARLPSSSTSSSGIVQLNNTVTSTSTTLALTANQGKVLNDNKLDKTANAASATKLQTARTINGVAFDGSKDITINSIGIWGGSANAPGTEVKLSHSMNDFTYLVFQCWLTVSFSMRFLPTAMCVSPQFIILSDGVVSIQYTDLSTSPTTWAVHSLSIGHGDEFTIVVKENKKYVLSSNQITTGALTLLSIWGIY